MSSAEGYRVSAIVSLYNSERFLQGRLEDLFEQTLYQRGALEIVIVDSGSLENERELVERARKSHAHIQYLRTDRRESLYQAWNRGIRMSSAPLLTNANADDRLSPDALESLASMLESNPSHGFAYGDAVLSVRANETFSQASLGPVYCCQDYFAPDLLIHQYLGHQPMWRKALHAKAGYFDNGYFAAGDYDFMLRAAVWTKGAHAREPLGSLLRRSDSITFKDGTINREAALIRDAYRTPEYALRLFQAEGVDVTAPGARESCFVELGNRALAYFPQWRSGRPDADIPFALQCYDWAIGSGNSGPEASVARKWARNNRAIAVFLGCIESATPVDSLVAGSEAPSPSRWADTVESDLRIAWPRLMAPKNYEGIQFPRTVFGKGDSSSESIGDWYAEAVDARAYWEALTGLDKTVSKSIRQRLPNGAELLIWGANQRGSMMAGILKSQGFGIGCFIDNDDSKRAQRFSGVPVKSPDAVADSKREYGILLACSEQQRPFISRQCVELGIDNRLLESL